MHCVGKRVRFFSVCTTPSTLLSSPVLCFLPSPHLTSPHLSSPHLTSPHLTSPHLTSPHLTSPHLTSPLLSSPLLSSPVLPLKFTLFNQTVPQEIVPLPAAKDRRSQKAQNGNSLSIDLQTTISKFGRDLHIHQMEDWYYVSAPHLKILNGGAALLRRYHKQK